MEFLLLYEVLKNWIFLQMPIKKSDFITLILSKFSILNANLWSIYSKRFEFMVYTCFCAFWKINIFWFLRPSKTSEALKKAQTLDSWPLTMPLKTRPWIRLVLKKCPVSTVQCTDVRLTNFLSSRFIYNVENQLDGKQENTTSVQCFVSKSNDLFTPCKWNSRI